MVRMGSRVQFPWAAPLLNRQRPKVFFLFYRSQSSLVAFRYIDKYSCQDLNRAMMDLNRAKKKESVETIAMSSPTTPAEVGARVAALIEAHKGPLLGTITVRLELPGQDNAHPTSTQLVFDIAGEPGAGGKPSRILVKSMDADCNAVVIEHAPGIRIFRLTGDFSGMKAKSVEALRVSIIESIGDTACHTAILNCGGMDGEKICSDGVSWLIPVIRNLKKKNGRAALTNRPDSLKNLMEVQKLDNRLCDMFETEEDALAAMGKQ